MAASIPMIRKALTAISAGALAFALSGCQNSESISSTNSDIGRMGVLLFHAVMGIGSSASVPRERAAAVPYASIGVRLGGSDEALFVLASKSGEDLLWLGGRNLALTTRHGRVVRTVGFEFNISGVHLAEAPQQESIQSSSEYLYDFAEQSRYGVPVKCTRQSLGPERIVIVGVSRDTSRVADDCSAVGLDWSFRNEFWIDAAGYVWKSRQFIGPRFGALTVEVLRPAAE